MGVSALAEAEERATPRCGVNKAGARNGTTVRFRSESLKAAPANCLIQIAYSNTIICISLLAQHSWPGTAG